jgi:hypothetical protein
VVGSVPLGQPAHLKDSAAPEIQPLPEKESNVPRSQM